ncbi:hypothetical protein D9M72_455890 [compost metagenome]
MQQGLGQVLVLRDRFGHGAGAVGLGGLDAALLAAPAKLHHRALRQAPVGNAARHGGVDDGAGARPQAHVLVQLAQAVQRVGEVERGVVARGAAQGLGQLERKPADFFLAVLHDHLVGAGLDRLRGAAEGDRAAGGGLQAQRRHFQHVGQRQLARFLVRAQRPDLRETGAQPVFKAGQRRQHVGGILAGHDRLDGGVAAPQVRAPQGPDT